jgi:hypothetical protein
MDFQEWWTKHKDDYAKLTRRQIALEAWIAGCASKDITILVTLPDGSVDTVTRDEIEQIVANRSD